MVEELHSLKGRHLETIKEYFFWAYAHLAMAQSAVDSGSLTYSRFDRMQGYAAFNGLMRGTRTLRLRVSDERSRQLYAERICSYCGAEGPLALDHLVARSSGGPDHPENLVPVCRRCNSSKGSSDLMEWMERRRQFLPLSVIKRYLKLRFLSCEALGLLEEIPSKHPTFPELPFAYPAPTTLTRFTSPFPRVLRPERARASIGALENGCRLKLRTHVSLAEIVHHILDSIGPAEVIFAIDRVDNNDLQYLKERIGSRLSSCRWLLSAWSSNPLPAIVQLFGAERVRCVPEGPQLVLFKNGSWSLVLFSTLNLNLNRGLASVELVDSREVLEQVFLEEFLPAWERGLEAANVIQGLTGDQQTFSF